MGKQVQKINSENQNEKVINYKSTNIISNLTSKWAQSPHTYMHALHILTLP